jgi:UDP-N-acetylglucosamine 2-epimerase (non-hydrolysing)
MNKILLCFGTRPEAIKMATLVHEFKKNTTFEVKVCVTAQHREMLDQVLDFFEVVPDFDLNLMKANQSLNQLSSRILENFDEVLNDYKPDLILVHGDTTTSTMCALASFNNNIKVGHVEAGLRTFNKYSPFPEEMNRIITGKIADFHFAPTTTSYKNLLEEKVSKNTIVVTGNTVIDSLFWTVSKLEKGYSNTTIENLKEQIDFNNKTILITAHRRENFGDGFIAICEAIKTIALENPTINFVFPVHLNPNVQKPVFSILDKITNVFLIAPLDYPSFVWAMKQSFIILTDSGGVQEEAPSLGVPVLVLRDTTERPEAVEAGTVCLVGTNKVKIINEVSKLLNDHNYYSKMSTAHNPYGDGNANATIINFLTNYVTK